MGDVTSWKFETLYKKKIVEIIVETEEIVFFFPNNVFNSVIAEMSTQQLPTRCDYIHHGTGVETGINASIWCINSSSKQISCPVKAILNPISGYSLISIKTYLHPVKVQVRRGICYCLKLNRRRINFL